MVGLSLLHYGLIIPRVVLQLNYTNFPSIWDGNGGSYRVWSHQFVISKLYDPMNASTPSRRKDKAKKINGYFTRKSLIYPTINE